MTKKAKTEPAGFDQTPGLLASVAELTGVVRSKDEALAVLQALVDEQAERIAELLESAAAPVDTAAQAERIAELEERLAAAQAVWTPAPGQAAATVGNLDEALQVMKDNGFKILTEVKIEDCKDEAGQRIRTFRNQGRYEVALVLKRG